MIDGGGRTLMPGLIDAHWHAMLVRPNPAVGLSSDIGYLNLLAGAEATATLMRGFTTIRDMGGPVFGLKRAIDEGLVAGPAHLSVRRGHHHHRRSWRLSPAFGSAADARRNAVAAWSRSAAACVADSPDEVRMRAREQLMQGASQIKLTAGGGVASPFSPLDVVDLHRGRTSRRGRSGRELGHLCHHPCLYAGVNPALDRCRREMHRARASDGRANGEADGGEGHLAQHAAVSRRRRRGRRRAARSGGTGEDEAGHCRHRHGLQACEEIPSQDRIRHRHLVFRTRGASSRAIALASLTRWYTPAEALIMATSTNAELLALSGLRNPYPGKLGVVEEGALADLLLVDGNPLENIKLVGDPAKNFNRHHERRQDLQEHRELTSTFW